MKRPILRASFFSTKFSGSKCFTSAAKFTGNPVVSKLWMGPIPLAPASNCCQTSGAVFPTPHNRPRPVTTTLRFDPLGSAWLKALLAAFRVLLDVVDRVLHGLDLLSILIRNLQVEGLFELHHKLDYVKRVGAQIFLK